MDWISYDALGRLAKVINALNHLTFKTTKNAK
jgi:hypothetical protein